jgi:predicted RecB family nuclease
MRKRIPAQLCIFEKCSSVGKRKQMAKKAANKRTCASGHVYYKSSTCPVCPVCEQHKIPESDFMAVLAAPARRALENAGIKTLKQLARLSEKELLALHGMGPSAVPKLKAVLAANGLKFKTGS